jgi:hypothetical protein
MLRQLDVRIKLGAEKTEAPLDHGRTHKLDDIKGILTSDSRKRAAGFVRRPPSDSGNTEKKGNVVVTDFDAATARTTQRRVGTALCIFVASIALAGCETGSSVLGGGPLATETAAPAVAAQPAKPAMTARIALAPIIGAPDAIGQQLRTQVTQASERQRIAIIADRDPAADFNMRGYLVAARDRGNVKISYIWDITDPSGKRVNRVTGEENVPGAPGKDPWSVVTPAVTQSIADKVASSLGAWAPSQPRAAVAAAGAAPAGGAAAAAPAQAPAAVAAGSGTTQATANTATAAISPAAGAMPVVSGAPGDGNTALASALNRELVRQGMPIDHQTGQAYRVDGQVSLGAVKDGKQSIQIDWRVKDGKGQAVGTVTQKNAIPPGSLDGPWGQTADAAAAAAAQGILKLLPQQAVAKATN